MKVMMTPHLLTTAGHPESGIKTLIAAYFKHLPAYGVELVGPKADSFDLLAVHAGMSTNYGDGVPMVSHLHGLYWTSDYSANHWEYKANASVIDSIRHATTVTVPSAWVAETLQRDMHLSPTIVPHGIDWQDWQHNQPNDGYVLWNKNRTGDVCDPVPVGELAQRFPKQRFLTTFAPSNPTPNIKATGLVPHDKMRGMVQRAGVYLATTKETFGIGILEALASGVPVLGFRHGGILESVRHGVNGYLAKIGDYDDLAEGLDYCLKHRATLGENGRALVRRFTWERVAEQLADIYQETIAKYHEPPTVSVIIPCYNYADKLTRAVESAINQTQPAHEIIIVDNNSTDDSRTVAAKLQEIHGQITVINEPRQGVAYARNRGVSAATGKYIICLDADDAIEPAYIATCVKALEADRSLGIAYTRLRWVKGDGSTGVSDWPSEYDYDAFLQKRNQVSTCCMYRRELWQRLGGYRQRFAPAGAGAEDAEFFLRAGAIGYGAKLVTQEPLFVYSWGTGRVSGNQAYQEPDWLAGKPWIQDKRHPFASLATPERQSHPVRQYDEPTVSVIIPCGPNHLDYLPDALDSLEAQTFRKWEAVVVFDNCTPSPELIDAYPFIRGTWANGVENGVDGGVDGAGAGAARNLGAKLARGQFLLFLDADDWLRPTAIGRMLTAWNETSAIIYSDHASHATVADKVEVDKLRMRGRLESYDAKTQRAIVLEQAEDYDCERAIKQPEQGGQFYVWSLTTSLVPKSWHDAVGGFDEKMTSWEDWDYWIRLARAGRCFVRIPEPLFDYRLDTGTRREIGRQIHESLLQYMAAKYERIKIMPCGSCGGNRQTAPAPQAAIPQMSMQMAPSNIIWVRLVDGNIGQHPIVGHVTRTNYGYRASGDLFKMVASDAAAAPHKYAVVQDPESAPVAAVEPEKQETPEPIAVGEEFSTWEDEPAAKPKRSRATK